jgi:tRNA(Arg) A34 adenosine deaminase TadA
MMNNWANYTQSDLYFLRLAIVQARKARECGEYPFGAVLVKDRDVVFAAHDQCLVLSDPTAHAEMLLISGYCRQERLLTLNGYIVYSSTEPCILCSGAIKWSRISKVVFSVSQEMLQQRTKGRPKPSCHSFVNIGKRVVEVVGPLIPNEGIAVFDGFQFGPKADRQ